MTDVETRWKNSAGRICWGLWFCGLYVTQLGAILFILLVASLLAPNDTLTALLGTLRTPYGPLAASSWLQVAVAFGMHSFADLNTGMAMMNLARNGPSRLPLEITVWNSSRFVISMLWALKIAHGLFHMTISKHLSPGLSPYALGLMVLLGVDALIIRPSAVYLQRALNDAYPPVKHCELKDSSELSFIQKCCRFVFFYESVLSGASGAVYFIFPELFVYLYGYPAGDSDPVALWCLSQFGVLVMTFGLYQMSCEIDRNRGMVLWWLILDIVWLYVYWDGTASRLGPWNPFTLTGANFWCHSAFHADSTLALARTLFLLSPSKKPSKKSD